MPTTYVELHSDERDYCRSVLEKHHPRLRAVTVDWLFAHGPKDDGGEIVGPAIKVRGHKALAKIRINNLESRVAGAADVRCVIDGDEWPLLSLPARESLIDHELTHIERKTKWVEGVEIGLTDDIGRPVLKMRHHDAEVGVFFEVMQRHKEEALDFQVVANLGKEVKERVQLTFWG